MCKTVSETKHSVDFLPPLLVVTYTRDVSPISVFQEHSEKAIWFRRECDKREVVGIGAKDNRKCADNEEGQIEERHDPPNLM
jgi:hypothetical protein